MSCTFSFKKNPAFGQNKVRADIFSGSLAVCLFASASRRGGRKGGSGGIPPAEPIGRKINSNFFVNTPPTSDWRDIVNDVRSILQNYSGYVHIPDLQPQLAFILSKNSDCRK